MFRRNSKCQDILKSSPHWHRQLLQALLSCISFHYSCPTRPLQSGPERSPYTLRIHSQDHLLKHAIRHRERGRPALWANTLTWILSPRTVTDLQMYKPDKVSLSTIFHKDLCESWQVGSVYGESLRCSLQQKVGVLPGFYPVVPNLHNKKVKPAVGQNNNLHALFFIQLFSLPNVTIWFAPKTSPRFVKRVHVTTELTVCESSLCSAHTHPLMCFNKGFWNHSALHPSLPPQGALTCFFFFSFP